MDELKDETLATGSCAAAAIVLLLVGFILLVAAMVELLQAIGG